MEKPSWNIQAALASLAGLIVLKCVLLGSLWAQVEPHPPASVGPFIAASLSLAVFSIPLVSWRTKIGYAISIIVGLLGLVSFSPLKFFYDESAGQVIPAIIVGTVFSVVLVIASITGLIKKN